LTENGPKTNNALGQLKGHSALVYQVS